MIRREYEDRLKALGELEVAIKALKHRRILLHTDSRVDVDSVILDLIVLRDDLFRELEAMWPGVCREVYAYYPEHNPFRKGGERMTEWKIEYVRATDSVEFASPDGMLRFTIPYLELTEKIQECREFRIRCKLYGGGEE